MRSGEIWLTSPNEHLGWATFAHAVISAFEDLRLENCAEYVKDMLENLNEEDGKINVSDIKGYIGENN